MAKTRVANGFVDPGGKAGVKENKSMANSLIKSLALTLGGGLAVGLGFKMGQGSVPPMPPPEAIDFGPVLDRIEGVETRIVAVEGALKEPGPMVIPSVDELENRVRAQSSEVEMLRAAIQQATDKHNARIDDLGYAMNTLETRIPTLIESSIKPKFEEMHERVQREMQETASQTLEIFADRIQSRVVEKITSIEGDLTRQSVAINDLRDYSLKTDQNLQRLLAGVENLADKINRKFDAPPESPRMSSLSRPAPATPPAPAPPMQTSVMVEEPPKPAPAPAPMPAPAPAPVTPPPPKPVNLAPSFTPAPQTIKLPDFPSKIELGEAADVRPPREPFPIPVPKSFSGPEFEELLAERPKSNGFRKAALAGGGVALAAVAFLGVEFSGILPKSASAHSNSTQSIKTGSMSSTDSLDTKKLTDQTELLDQARSFSQKREYSKAEDIYRTILKTDPSNTEVKRLLASALFRQEKIDESVKVLNSISEDKGAAAPETPQQ